MPDTIRGNFPDKPCSDCGKVGEVCFQHWGPLVPTGQFGNFCGTCMSLRNDDYKAGKSPRPIGEMACRACNGSGQTFIVDRVVQGQSYGPETEGHNEPCPKCGGTGKVIRSGADTLMS